MSASDNSYNTLWECRLLYQLNDDGSDVFLKAMIFCSGTRSEKHLSGMFYLFLNPF